MKDVLRLLESERETERRFIGQAESEPDHPTGWPASLLMSHIASWREQPRERFVQLRDGGPTMPPPQDIDAFNASNLARDARVPLAGAAARSDQVLADLDQGAVTNLPVDGYVSTLAWTQQHPKTAAAFIRAIEQGQEIANHDVSAVQAIMAQNDKLPPQVTASMAVPGTYPVGPVVAANIQRVAAAMLQFGVLGQQYATQVRQGTVVRSMITSG